MAIEPTEADKAAAEEITLAAIHDGSWILTEDEIEPFKAQAATVISRYMATERAEAAKVKGELEATRSLLFDTEVALVNSRPGCHPECDKGVCTHPLKLVRQALAATKPRSGKRG